MVNYEVHYGRGWSWVLTVGLILLLLGLISISTPLVATVTIVKSTGWILVIAGFFQFFQWFSSDIRAWVGAGSATTLAMFYFFMGIFMIVDPLSASDLMISLSCLFFFIAGGMKLVLAWQMRYQRYSYWMWLTGILGILVALYIVLKPPQFKALFVAYLLGFYLMCHGVSLVFSAIGVRAICRSSDD